MNSIRVVLSICFLSLSLTAQADWPQAAGSHGNFQTKVAGPVHWSVAREENIVWKVTLPETGQSTPVVSNGKVFFTTNQQVDSDAEIGKDIVAWCCDAENGNVLWQRPMKGMHPMRLSGCFGDSSSPPAVCDGERVVFASSSGSVACFEMDGRQIWSREFLTVNRTLPFIHQGKVFLTRQVYPPEPSGVFPHKYKDAPKSMWTQLHALDIYTGKDVMTTECGVNMGCAIIPQKLSDGTDVVVVGRGGGHGPPETPDGISLVNLADASTIWTVPLEGFMATMSYQVRNDRVHVFHLGEHLSIDAKSGEIVRRHSIVDEVAVRGRQDGKWSDRTVSIPVGKNKRMITQTSNLLVGPWHYFRSYTRPWIGRVNVDTGTLEYLELPLQLSRSTEIEDRFQWYTEPKKKQDTPLKYQSIVANAMKNSRGFVVMGDKRSEGNGWGHVAAPTPTVAGKHLYVPVQNGTVYVIDWNRAALDEQAVVSINDLGPAGQSFTRSSVSFSDGKLYAHTINAVICVGR